MSQGKTRRRFTKEFRIEAVQLSHQPGMTGAKAAADLGVAENRINRWRAELARTGDDAFRGNGNRTGEQAELERLRRENQTLRMERDILKKAVRRRRSSPSSSSEVRLHAGTSKGLAGSGDGARPEGLAQRLLRIVPPNAIRPIASPNATARGDPRGA